MGHLHTSVALHWEQPLAPIEQEAVWTPELFWDFWRTEKSLTSAGIQTPDRPARGIIATLSLINLQAVCFKEHLCAQRAHIMLSIYF
jgi:hypothetical protein